MAQGRKQIRREVGHTMIPNHTQNVLDAISKRQRPAIRLEDGRLEDGSNLIATFPSTFVLGVTPFLLVVDCLHQIGTQN